MITPFVLWASSLHGKLPITLSDGINSGNSEESARELTNALASNQGRSVEINHLGAGNQARLYGRLPKKILNNG